MAMMTTTGSVRPRILAAMTLLLLLLGVASGWAWHDVTRIDDWTRALSQSDEAMHRVQAVATTMRDAYAHQAHMIILDDRSHLDHYAASHRAAEAALRRVQEVLNTPPDSDDLLLVGRALAELDGSFRRDVLPHMSSPHDGVAAAHGRAVMLVESAQLTLNRIDARLQGQATQLSSSVSEARVAVGQRALLLLLLALGVIVAVAVLLDRQIALPVQQLARGVQSLRDGAWSGPLTMSGNHELAQLGAGFNAMAIELERRQTALLAAERLAGIGRLAAGVAHELNNPLAVMQGHLHLLRKQVVSDDVDIIAVEIARCQQIISGLLELSRPPRLHVVEVDVIELLRDAGVSLLSSTPMIISADDGKVVQIVRNLVQNARDAAPSHPVEAEVIERGQDMVMRIGDRGPGVSPAMMATLFEPFATNKPNGTGLGLAISRRLAQAHGGHLQLEPREGGGTWAVLSLPKTARESS